MEKNSNNDHQSTNITHDFMRVESFSQLPFIRPPPTPFFKEKPVRLFGIEFNGNNTTITTDSSGDQILNELENTDKEQDQDGSNPNDVVVAAATTNGNTNNGNRKFECHYCCRNFPTSQALGGHQNAHKRERQHAKRVHLQSAAVLHGALGGWPSPNLAGSSIAYHSRLYENHHGSYYTHPPPINGSPLGLWRIPTVQTSSFHRDRHSMPMFTDLNESMRQPSTAPPQSVAAGPALRHFYDHKPAVQDHHVSLDLHL